MSLFDFLSDAFESLASSVHTDDSPADWTNAFGTANDNQVPAESDSFSSSDWSTFNNDL